MKIVTSSEMSKIDSLAQEIFGIPQVALMENAGSAVSRNILKDFPGIQSKKIAIFCGKGNNGGDGFVCARHLFNENPKNITVFIFDEKAIKGGASSDNFNIVKKLKIDLRSFDSYLEAEGNKFDIVIDSVFGTGFSGAIPVNIEKIFKKINSENSKKYAVDVPSGLDATTGKAARNTIIADKTITFGLAKTGFFIEDGPKVCGDVIIEKIGFPRELLQN